MEGNFEKFYNFLGNPHRSAPDPKRTLLKQTRYRIEMQNSIQTPREFFDQVVTPDCEELRSNPGDVRIAFHASTSLHHLREWVLKASLTEHKRLDEYSPDLYQRCPDLKVIRDLASNAKHFPPDPGKAEKMEVGVSAASAIGCVARLGQSKQTQVIAKKDDGSRQWMIPIILNAYSFWKKEFLDNGW